MCDRRRRWGVIDDDGYAWLPADALLGGRLQRLEMVLDEPVARESVGCADAEVIALHRHEPARTNPRVHDGGREVTAGRVQDTRPKTV